MSLPNNQSCRAHQRQDNSFGLRSDKVPDTVPNRYRRIIHSPCTKGTLAMLQRFTRTCGREEPSKKRPCWLFLFAAFASFCWMLTSVGRVGQDLLS